MTTPSTTTPPDPLNTLTLDQLRTRTSVKWREYAPDVLPLWVAEMDVVPAPGVVDAVSRALRDGDTGYDHGYRYAEAWASYAADRWGWDVDPSLTMTVADVMTGVVQAVSVLTEPGDVVVVSPPVYPPFYQFVPGSGRRVLDAPLTSEGRLDLDDGGALDRAFAVARAGGRAAAYLLANPHNPTGVAHTREELERLVALADRHGVRVVSDEIHAPLSGRPGVDDVPPFTSVLQVPGGDRALALVSPSKAWNLAGLRAALLVAGPGAAADLARVPGHVLDGVNHVGVIAQTAALETGRGWLDDVLTGLDTNRALLAELLADRLPQVRYRRAHATYLAWLDCRDLGLGDDPSRAFLDRGRVALNPGPTFGAGGAGHVRLNLATSTAILTEAVARMASVV
ncbi:MalY/PatB family protein [Luteimicrobium sp. DT211]|uniref:MalY/PatB family protein n=1 Tax=Luteimicrobium sp. DT211 TaxID=3393412 RepID=UPI003CF97DF7